jgi:16S rRNA (guanine966-N2)-methyltransferase
MRRGTGLRVIAGTAGGLHLEAPKGGRIRPTTDRVRESLFASLDQHFGLGEASVLDLFAGSGALAIEALSRGAASAVLVDKNVAAVESIRRNLAATRLRDRSRVWRSSVTAFLTGEAPPEAPFDLVLLDPPYAATSGEVERTLQALEATGWLAPGAAIVVERAAADPRPMLPMSWEIAWERSYGDTLVIVAVTNRPISQPA